MKFLFPPEMQDNLRSTALKPPYNEPFLLPYAQARCVEGPFGKLYTQAVDEEQYQIGFQAAFNKTPVKFTVVRDRPCIMLLYVFQGDLTVGNKRGRKRKLEEFASYIVYAPEGAYTVEAGTGINAVLQFRLPDFAVELLCKHPEIAISLRLYLRDSPVDFLHGISDTSYQASDIITSLLYTGRPYGERVIFQIGRIMDLLLLLADDLAALDLISTGRLKFTPGDIQSVQDALSFQAGYENTPMKLGELARAVNMHPKKLNAGFRLLTGKTSRELAAGVMIEKAKNLLRETKMRISEIAYETGYCNSSAFVRAFKRYVGISPSAYRK